MQSLLRWSLQHSSPLDSALTDKPPLPKQRIDTGVIDMLLGKPDAALMKEDMKIVVDSAKSEAERLQALDHLENLVDNIDNANDLGKLRLWDPLISLLNSKESSPEIKTHTLWVIGTAIQNNPVAQDEYLSRNPLHTLFKFLASPTPALRSKAIYALSGLLKHNAAAVFALQSPEINGWPKLRNALKDSDISVRRKVAFLLMTLLKSTNASSTADQQKPGVAATVPLGVVLHRACEREAMNPNIIHPNSHAALLQNPSRTDTAPIARSAFQEHGILDAVVECFLDSHQADGDFQAYIVNLLLVFITDCGARISVTQRALLEQSLERAKTVPLSEHSELKGSLEELQKHILRMHDRMP